MTRKTAETQATTDTGEASHTLLPMLIGGLVMITVGMIAIMYLY